MYRAESARGIKLKVKSVLYS